MTVEHSAVESSIPIAPVGTRVRRPLISRERNMIATQAFGSDRAAHGLGCVRGTNRPQADLAKVRRL
jgi:hypothetical protein